LFLLNAVNKNISFLIIPTSTKDHLISTTEL
jgi:hypothetical protein